MATNKSTIATLDDEPAALIAAEAEASKSVQGNNHDGDLSGQRVRVTFFEQEGDLGKDAIFAGLNGVAYNIPRGVPVDIPVEVLDIFTSAKMRSIETTQAGGQRERDVMRFAYQVHGLIPQAA